MGHDEPLRHCLVHHGADLSAPTRLLDDESQRAPGLSTDAERALAALAAAVHATVWRQHVAQIGPRIVAIFRQAVLLGRFGGTDIARNTLAASTVSVGLTDGSGRDGKGPRIRLFAYLKSQESTFRFTIGSLTNQLSPNPG